MISKAAHLHLLICIYYMNFLFSGTRTTAASRFRVDMENIGEFYQFFTATKILFKNKNHRRQLRNVCKKALFQCYFSLYQSWNSKICEKIDDVWIQLTTNLFASISSKAHHSNVILLLHRFLVRSSKTVFWISSRAGSFIGHRSRSRNFPSIRNPSLRKDRRFSPKLPRDSSLLLIFPEKGKRKILLCQQNFM